MFRLIVIFSTSVFLSLNFGSQLYVASSYLESFFSTGFVSLLFLLGAVGNILLFLLSPKLLNRIGKPILLFFFLLILTLCTLTLAFSNSGLNVAAAFLVYSSVFFLAYYCLDIFLEEVSADKHTGEIRGIYGMFMNGGIAAGPLLLSLIVRTDELRPIFLSASALLMVATLISLLLFKKSSVKRHHEPHKLPWRAWWQKANVRRVTIVKFVLETFFAVMVIYTPLYLHGELGFAWSELGVMFTIMLLPFVIFEWPAGKIADKYLGEKEMMSAGLFIMGVTLLLMPFINKVYLFWVLVLFFSRVGASLVEIMTETYFFKKIDEKDAGLLSIFRLSRPVSIIVGAIVGALTLKFFSFQGIFFVTAFIVFLGLRESAYIKDTK